MPTRNSLLRRFEQIQSQLEALRLFGVEGYADAALRGDARQLPDTREQLRENAVALGFLEPRMQRGQLDGKGVGRAHRIDGARVGGQVVRGVLRGAGGFPQHVEGEAIRPALGAPLHRVLDGLGEHELAGEDAHRLAHRGAHDRLAQPRDQPFYRRWKISFLGVMPFRQRPRQHQRPVGGAGRAPVAAGKLVANQRVGGVGVGNAQQRFGHAHQRDAFGCGEAVVAQERLRGQRRWRRGAHALGEPKGLFSYSLRSPLIRLKGAQPLDRLRFGDAVHRPQVARHTMPRSA